jgi:hypothetical protein
MHGTRPRRRFDGPIDDPSAVVDLSVQLLQLSLQRQRLATIRFKCPDLLHSARKAGGGGIELALKRLVGFHKLIPLSLKDLNILFKLDPFGIRNIAAPLELGPFPCHQIDEAQVLSLNNYSI